MKRQLWIDGKLRMEAESIIMRVGENYVSYYTLRKDRRGRFKVTKAITVGTLSGAEVRLI